MIRQSSQWLMAGLVGVSAGLLAGCGSAPASRDEGRGAYKVGKTYTVMGQTYTPHEDYDYHETGQASWYGPGFHGRYTANGEVYNQHERTGAHRTLPMPAVVLVTNLDNGLSTMVRINDRGPFAHGRIIDLSRKAAEDIQMVGAGVANVRVDILRRESEIVKEIALNGGGPVEQMAALMHAQKNRGQEPVVAKASPPPPQAPPPMAIAAVQTQMPKPVPASSVSGAFFVQAGAFGTMANAERARNRVSGIGEAAITPVTVNGQDLYRLRIGPIADASQADRTLSQVQRVGFADARVVIE